MHNPDEDHDVADLRPTGRYYTINPDFDEHGADQWLVNDVRTNGIRLPLLITPAGMIIDGVRRWEAARVCKIQRVRAIECPRWYAESPAVERPPSLFKTLSSHHDWLWGLAQRDADQERGTVAPASAARNTPLAQDWAQTERNLGFRRLEILSGLEALQRIYRVTEGDHQARRNLLNIFRNYGLNPVQRVLDLNESPSQQPDCKAWDTGDDHPESFSQHQRLALINRLKQTFATKNVSARLRAALTTLERYA